MIKRALIAVGVVAITSLGTLAPTLAHGPGASGSNQPGCGWHYGWHMGPGMMGRQGQMPMMGGGMMGQQGQMGPGMTGQQGQMPMMGGGMMGRGQMGPGVMGHGMMRPLRQDLTAAEVEHIIGHHLAWQGNPNIKVGTVEEKDDDTVVAEIVTQDGSLVQRLEVDRHTGWMRPAQ